MKTRTLDARRTAAFHGFTLVEMLVTIAVIALLASLLLPALGVARGRAKDLSCVSTLKQIAIMAFNYVDNNQGYLPPLHTGAVSSDPDAYEFVQLIQYDNNGSYKLDKIWECPADPAPHAAWHFWGRGSYAPSYLTGSAILLTQVRNPAQKMLLADSKTAYCINPWDVPKYLSIRHQNKSGDNFLHMDGHCAFLMLNSYGSSMSNSLYNPTY